MKRLLALILAVIVLVPAFAAADGVVRIGVFEPSSGMLAEGGKQEILGIEYARSLTPTVTVGGETYTVELVMEDNQSQRDTAVSAAQALVDQKVSVVLGSYGSGVTLTGGDVFEQARVPAIAASSTNPSVTMMYDCYWRVCFLDSFQGTGMADYAWERGATKAYVLTELGDDYSVELGNCFMETFRNRGGDVVKESFPEGTADFASYITNAVSAGCDVMFAPCAAMYGALIINEAAAQGVSFPILSGDTWDNAAIRNAAEDRDVKVYCAAPFDEFDASAAVIQFVSGFRDWLNADSGRLADNGGTDSVSAVSALGFDAYNVALAAIRAADSTDPAAIADALPGVTWIGATGSFFFDGNGDVLKDRIFVKCIRDPEAGVHESMTYTLRPGQIVKLPFDDAVSLESADDALLSVSGTAVRAKAAGTVDVTVTYRNGDKGNCSFIILEGTETVLPDDLETVEEEAFTGDEALIFLTLSRNTKRIGKNVFVGTELKQLTVLSADTEIDDTATEGLELTILCPEGSAAAEFALRNKIPYLFLTKLQFPE